MTETPHHGPAEQTDATRRSILATLGGAALGVAALGIPASRAAAADPGDTPQAGAGLAAACVLTPEQTEGPYYLDLETVRKDITEGKAGVPLTLRVTVVDIATEVTPVVRTHLTMDLVDPERCRSTWHGPRSTV
ncbi:hypothetical protein ACFY2I_54245, partial [Streptomyces mirabilis]